MKLTKPEAYQKMIVITEAQIKILNSEKDAGLNPQIEMRQELLRYFEKCQQGYSFDVRENLILNTLRTKGQNLRQRYRDNLLH